MGASAAVDLPPGYRPEDVLEDESDLPPGYSAADVLPDALSPVAAQPATIGMGEARRYDDRSPLSIRAEQRRDQYLEETPPSPVLTRQGYPPERQKALGWIPEPVAPSYGTMNQITEVTRQPGITADQLRSGIAYALKSGGGPPGAEALLDSPEGKAALEFAAMNTSPENIALLVGTFGLNKFPMAAKAAQAYFETQMGGGAVHGAASAIEAARRGDIPEARYQATTGALSGGMMVAPRAIRKGMEMAGQRRTNANAVESFPMDQSPRGAPAEFERTRPAEPVPVEIPRPVEPVQPPVEARVPEVAPRPELTMDDFEVVPEQAGKPDLPPGYRPEDVVQEKPTIADVDLTRGQEQPAPRGVEGPEPVPGAPPILRDERRTKPRVPEPVTLAEEVPEYREAGFRDSETGQVYGTGPVHNYDKLPRSVLNSGKYDQLESGFITKDGEFRTAEQVEATGVMAESTALRQTGRMDDPINAPETAPQYPPRTADTMSDAIAMSSPSGSMSKRAADEATARLGKTLFGEKGLQREPTAQPSQAESLRRQAKQLRDLSERGMKSRSYAKKAAELEAQAAELEGKPPPETLAGRAEKRKAGESPSHAEIDAMVARAEEARQKWHDTPDAELPPTPKVSYVHGRDPSKVQTPESFPTEEAAKADFERGVDSRLYDAFGERKRLRPETVAQRELRERREFKREQEAKAKGRAPGWIDRPEMNENQRRFKEEWSVGGPEASAKARREKLAQRVEARERATLAQEARKVGEEPETLASRAAERSKDRPESLIGDKYSDGRTIPKPGDEVFMSARGFGGMEAFIEGTVQPNGRVKLEGASGLMTQGVRGAGKTVPLDRRWSVRGDPELTRRKEAKEAKRAAEKKAHDDAETAAVGKGQSGVDAALAAGDLPIDDPSIRPGMKVTDHRRGVTGTIDDMTDYGPTVRWSDEPIGTAGATLGSKDYQRRTFTVERDSGTAISEFSPEASERQRRVEESDATMVAEKKSALQQRIDEKAARPKIEGKQIGIFGETDRGLKLDQRDIDFDFGANKVRQAAGPRPQLNVSPERLPAGEVQRTPSQIVKQIEESFGRFGYLPVRTKHFREQAHGIFKHPPEVVRLKVANDVVTLAHELGHYVQDSVLKLPTGKGQPYELELERLGRATSKASYKPDQIQNEGTAEFMRQFLLDPDKARKDAPAYAAAFEDALSKNPDLAEAINQTQRQLRGHYAQTPVDRIKSKIDFKGEDDAKTGTRIERFMRRWVDDLQPLKDAVRTMDGGQSKDVLGDAYALARLSRGAPGKAEGFLRFGVKGRGGQSFSESFSKALDPVKGKLEDFSAYLAARRAVELHGRGIESGMDRADANAAVTALQSQEFVKAASSVYAYSDALLKYARTEGVLSAEQVAKIRKLNEAYVPFQRVRDAVEMGLSGTSKKLADRGSPIKRIRGSGRDVVNPLESIVRNTYTIVDMVEKNTAMRALVRQAAATEGGGRFIEKIPSPMEATQFNLQALTGDIRRSLEQAGVDLPDNLRDSLNEAVTVFTPSGFSRERGVITIVENGKRQFYSVNEPALYDAITAIGGRNSEMVVGLLERPARLLRAGATLTLGFIGRNPVRDTFGAAVNTRYGFKPGWDTLRGLAEFMKKGEAYQDFLNSGGANATLVSADRNSQRQMLKRLSGDKKFRDSIVLHPIELLRSLSEATENATRLGEFMRGVKKEGRTAEGLGRAALAARDVTLDFARGGTSAREINRYTAFFNAQVQGGVRLAEVFKQNPVGATMRAVSAITLPTLAVAYLNRDDKDYANLPDWEKNTFWHIKSGNDWIRIPKPHGPIAMVFANGPEALIRHIVSKDADALDRLFPDDDTAWAAIIGLTPTAIMPMIEAYANYDTYRKRAIVSPWDLGVDKELQASRWTSELARVVGPKMGLAPAKFDHLINGYTAGFGRGVVRSLDKPLRQFTGRPEPPGRGAAGLPLVSAFYRNAPGADAEVLGRFYDRLEEIEGSRRSVKLYKEQGRAERGRERLAEANKKFNVGNLEGEAKRMRAAAKQLSGVRDEVDKIFASEARPDEKRQQLDAAYRRMVRIATMALPEWRKSVLAKEATDEEGASGALSGVSGGRMR